MTPLRQRMLEDMQLHGLSARTQQTYLSAIRQLALHYGKAPDHITEDELRQYFLFLRNERHAARSTMTIALCVLFPVLITPWSTNLVATPSAQV